MDRRSILLSGKRLATRRCLFILLTPLMLIFVLLVVNTKQGKMVYVVAKDADLVTEKSNPAFKDTSVTNRNNPVYTATTVGRSLEKRHEHLRRMCNGSTLFRSSKVDLGYPMRKRLSRNDEHRLIFCGIEKIGSSYWKRMFKVLAPENSEMHLFDIPYYKAHQMIPSSMSMKKVPADQLRSMFSTYTSFMFTRDPFARLFSGYLDKIVLPNSVGDRFYLPYIKKKFMKRMPSLCVYNVTFDMMAEFMADAILKADNRLEGHFSPSHDLCHPCQMDYTYIGKMESFKDDSNYILSSAGLDLQEITGEQHKGESDELNDKGTIADVASLTFQYLQENKVTCLKKKDFLHRIWRVLQMRGVMSKYDNLPHFDNIDNLTVDEFIRETVRVYDSSKTTREERQAQRNEALDEAFRSLSAPLLMRLAKAFQKDCQMFDYDCDVSKRFPQTKFSYLNFNLS